MNIKNFNEVDAVEVSAQMQNEETTLSMMLGTNKGNRRVAIIHLVIGGLVVMLAGPKFDASNWFNLAANIFCASIILLVGVVVVRCMLPVLPLRVTFACDTLSYDSGRPSAMYLIENAMGPMDFLLESLTPRYCWSAVRSDLQNRLLVVESERQEFADSVGYKRYDFSKIPDNARRRIQSAIHAWIQAEPSSGAEQAVQVFLNSSTKDRMSEEDNGAKT